MQNTFIEYIMIEQKIQFQTHFSKHSLRDNARRVAALLFGKEQNISGVLWNCICLI